jgi:DNA-directed RNA polymerase specialized sigma24 family protein
MEAWSYCPRLKTAVSDRGGADMKQSGITGFSQAEIAQMLGLQPKQVSRRWLAATGQLAQWLKAFREPF